MSEIAEKLADDHWEYISGILHSNQLYSEEVMELIKFHYVTAFVHGYKHGEGSTK